LGVAAAVMATEGWSHQNPHIPMKGLAVEDVESVRVAMNKGVFKNAFSIYIPNTGGRQRHSDRRRFGRLV